MLRRIVVLVSIVLLTGLTTVVFADAWTDAAPADSYYGTPGNWSDGVVPDISREANIRSMGGTYPTLNSGSYEAFALNIDGLDSGDIPSLTITGGSLLTGTSENSEAFKVGHGDFTYGLLNIYDGSLTNIAIGFLGTRGFGTINMYGGEMTQRYFKVGNRTASADHQAYMNLYDGMVICTVGLELRGDSVTDIYGGTLKIVGENYVNTMNNAVTNGNLIGYGGAGDVQIAFDGTYTVVTAIPEPMTVALLGLGGLFIRRRKR